MDPIFGNRIHSRIMQMTIFTIRRHTLAADCRKGQLWIMASNIPPPHASHNSRARNYDPVLLEHYRRTDFIINEIYVFVWYIRDWKGRKNRPPLSRQMAFGFLTWPPVNKTEMEAKMEDCVWFREVGTLYWGGWRFFVLARFIFESISFVWRNFVVIYKMFSTFFEIYLSLITWF